MTELRRCSPEIERELHDLEARIRELEVAMDEAWGVIANASDWIPKEPGTPCERSRADWQEAAERWRDERFHPLLRAASPPDSEPTEGKKEITEKSHALEYASRIGEQGAGDYAYSRGEDARLDKHLIERGAIPEWGSSAYTPPQRRDTGDALREKLADPEAMQRVTERAAEQQDAMLERRNALASLDRIDNMVVLDTPNGRTTLGDHKRDEVETIRQYLSRTSDAMRHALFILRHGESPPEVTREDTIRRLERAIEGCSDEGTGCGVPEAVRRLPEKWRARMKRLPATDDPGANAARSASMLRADELDRAIAEQGGQRVPKEAVGYAAIGDDGNVKGLWVLRDWDHAEAFADSCGCSLAPVFFGPQGDALAAAPQPEHGVSNE